MDAVVELSAGRIAGRREPVYESQMIPLLHWRCLVGMASYLIGIVFQQSSAAIRRVSPSFTGFFSFFSIVGPFFLFVSSLGRLGRVSVTVRCWACCVWYSRAFPGLYWVLPGFTGFFWVLLDYTGFYWVLLGFTGFYWVLLGFTGFYWVLLGFTGFCWF